MNISTTILFSRITLKNSGKEKKQASSKRKIKYNMLVIHVRRTYNGNHSIG